MTFLWLSEKVLHLENVEKNINSLDRQFKTEFPQQRTKLQQIFYNPQVEWYWQCLLKPPFMRTLAVILGSLSLMVVWSELTFFNRSPVLSIFANVVNLAKGQHDFLTIELFSMATLCYLCYCAYSTVFRIKFLNLYYLAPHHATNEHSLIFSGMMLCRLTPPMCLNFLGLIHMDSHIIRKRISETYYTQIMGHMDVLSIISDGFNIYFPMVMLAFCLATWYSLGRRALNAFGFQQFMLNEIGQDESISNEFILDGKGLIDREKRRRQRSEESRSRRRGNQFQSREMVHNSRPNPENNGNNNGRGFDASRTSTSDGLLGDGGSHDYNATNRQNRPLYDEINERFGDSTRVTVGFKGYNDLESDNEDGGRKWDTKAGPPRGLFDDV